jgi:hypothetical protein
MTTLQELLALFVGLGVSHNVVLNGVARAMMGAPQTIPISPAKITVGRSLLTVALTEGGLSLRWSDKGP